MAVEPTVALTCVLLRRTTIGDGARLQRLASRLLCSRRLGAGLGVAGLSAARCGAKSVTLIDREPLALHCAMSTASVCGLPTGPVPMGPATGGLDGEVSASVADWGALAADGLVVEVVLASEVLYDVNEAEPLARAAARLLRKGGTLLLADPAGGRVARARSAASAALEALGARVSEEPLAMPPAGDGWYAVRAGDGVGAVPSERIVLLRAVFEGPPLLCEEAM